MMRKRLILFMITIIIIGVLLALILLSSTKSLYQVGNVAKGINLSASLDPLKQKDGEPFFQVEENIKLYYYSQGNGRNVIIVHGGPGMPYAESWPGLDSLSDSYKFIYYDQRGSGKSTRPIDTFESKNYYKNMQELETSLGLTAQIADIERIRRIIGDEKLIIIGHSYGAVLASLYAAEFPEKVEALIYVAPAPLLKMPIAVPDLFDNIKNELPDHELENYNEFLDRYFDYKNLFKYSENDLIDLNNELGKYFYMAIEDYDVSIPLNSEAGGWMVQAMYLSCGQQYDYTQEISKVSVPTLIIHAGNDFVQDESASKMYLEILPQAEYLIMEDVGHFPFYDDATGFSKIIKEFLSDNDIK